MRRRIKRQTKSLGNLVTPRRITRRFLIITFTEPTRTRKRWRSRPTPLKSSSTSGASVRFQPKSFWRVGTGTERTCHYQNLVLVAVVLSSLPRRTAFLFSRPFRTLRQRPSLKSCPTSINIITTIRIRELRDSWGSIVSRSKASSRRKICTSSS